MQNCINKNGKWREISIYFYIGGKLKYTLKWFFLFWGVSIFTFFLVHSLPVSPVEMLLQKYNLPLTPENKEILIKQYGLDKSLIEQYIYWMADLVRGNLGVSFFSKISIKEEFLRRIPYSALIGLLSLFFANLFAFFLGYLAAIREGGFFDKITRVFSIVSLSLPSFLFSILIIYYFGVKIRAIQFFTGNSFWGIFFSIFILSFYQMSHLTRIVKNAFVNLKEQTYVQFYLIRGFSMEYTLLFHGYKPVLYSLFSASIAKFSSVIGGSSVLEFAFSVPGVSYFLITSIIARDYNIIQAYILFVFLWMFLVHLFFDLLLLYFREKTVE